ncbi:unnamed protein product [Amoebophrya sp. A120]|nr:unnamed protein product [Amoebophrya sp. A120]|eukprot:GSA120T00021972001.1
MLQAVEKQSLSEKSYEEQTTYVMTQPFSSLDHFFGKMDDSGLEEDDSDCYPLSPTNIEVINMKINVQEGKSYFSECKKRKKRNERNMVQEQPPDEYYLPVREVLVKILKELPRAKKFSSVVETLKELMRIRGVAAVVELLKTLFQIYWQGRDFEAERKAAIEKAERERIWKYKVHTKHVFCAEKKKAVAEWHEAYGDGAAVLSQIEICGAV